MKNIGKTIAAIILTVLFAVYPAQGDIEWTSGYHEINSPDIYGEIWMWNDATAAMFGGQVYKLEALDTSSFDFYGGEMEQLLGWDYTTIDLYGGELSLLGAYENSTVNLYAYDVLYHMTGGGSHGDDPWIEGRYYNDDVLFSFDLWGEEVYSHINVVPEPATFLLFGLGGLMLRRRK
jgi:hypothetical protein